MGTAEPQTVVLLHGFGGTRHAWDGVAALLPRERYRPLALDLPGHGEAAGAARPITFEGCVESVLARAPRSFVLCGYSMGGRVALHVALAAPRRVSRLVLVASSAGIQDERERAARRDSDEQLARQLEEEPYERFVERWRSQPLFAGEPPEVGERARADQLRNDPLALAAVLRGIGTGQMTPLWNRLGELVMKVAVVAGERDRKFCELGQRMVESLPRGELIVVPGGHGLPLESPKGVTRALLEAP